jgi:hypothetical protein
MAEMGFRFKSRGMVRDRIRGMVRDKVRGRSEARLEIRSKAGLEAEMQADQIHDGQMHARYTLRRYPAGARRPGAQYSDT